MINFDAISTNTYFPTRPESSADSSESTSKDRSETEETKTDETTSPEKKSPGVNDSKDLTSEELRELTDMKQRDREVKAHEQAHIAAGGSYVTSGAKLEYEEGPDGKKYATSGEVSIDTSKVPGDPEATLRKMQTIRSAALAPATPSGQDRKVASQATRIENQSRMEILTLRYEEAAALPADTSGTESSDTDATGQNPQRPSVSLGGLIDISR
jgi:hypothetical protein